MRAARPFPPLLLLAVALSACGGHGPAAAAADDAFGLGSAIAQVARARCVSCHPAPADAPRELQAPLLRPLPVGARAAGAWLPAFLATHHAGDDAARDLAAFLHPGPGIALEKGVVPAAAVERGGVLWRELGCAACHPLPGIDGLAARTDHRLLTAFLGAGTGPRDHDFALDGLEAQALAAFLLRAQLQDASAAPPPPGLAVECYELPVDDAALPEFAGRKPTASGFATTVDVGPRTRDNDFALRFSGQLQVPADGDYTFVAGADDCVWLWLDGELLIENAEIAPHRRREAKKRLAAGAHALQVVYTEDQGEQTLEVLWRGPGFELEPLPARALSSRCATLAPPAPAPPPEPAAVARGRTLFAAHRCGACHDRGPPAAVARPLMALDRGDCAQSGCAVESAALVAAQRAARAPLPKAAELWFRLLDHGCLACHQRGDHGGLPSSSRDWLAEVEDLGTEGRLPPDLTGVGHRLQRAWAERALRGEVRARPYLRARMPRLPAADAADFAQRFAELDQRPGDDVEPEFSAAQVERGRKIAGSSGRNCITCHPFAGRRALGPQGMDLAIQHERLTPAWFRDWLLHATRLRPGTRMPQFWWRLDDVDRTEVDAVRSWLSLGPEAPVPNGFPVRGNELVLDPIDGPRLHGAFLGGLSARCLAVGSPERVHYAYDFAHCYLAWLWRGAFVDADGTWTGRAGKLLKPLGQQHVVLDDLRLGDGAGDRSRRALGWRRDADGYPVFRTRVGTAEFEDHPRPRLADGGSELVRTLRCVGGTLRVAFGTGGPVQILADGRPAAGEHELAAGKQLELVYRW